MPNIIKETFPAGQLFVFIEADELTRRLKARTAKAIPGMPNAYEAVVRKRSRKKEPTEAELLGDQKYKTRNMTAKKGR